jgi:hypothetical protein
MSSTVESATDEWIPGARLDPKSPYIGNFHRGHAHSSMDALEYRLRTRSMLRSCSETNLSLEMAGISNLEASSFVNALRNGMSAQPNTPIGEEGRAEKPNLFGASPLDADDEQKNAASSRNSNRFNLDGVPATPELCALQAILPKQVSHSFSTSIISARLWMQSCFSRLIMELWNDPSARFGPMDHSPDELLSLRCRVG